MTKPDEKMILTIDEHTLFQLLDGRGTVHIRIDRFGRYFVPYVFFSEANTDEIKPRGVIVRNNYMLGAETMQDIFSVLHGIAGKITAVNINMIGRSGNYSGMRETRH